MRTLTYLMAFLFPLITYAQNHQEENREDLSVLALLKEKENKGVYDTFKEEDRGKTALIYRHHKPLSATFTGYLIELIRSDVPLQRKNEMFKHFGNVCYDKLDDGSYSYGFVVNFSRKKSMEEFLQQVVRPKVAGAQIIQYKKGIRKTK